MTIFIGEVIHGIIFALNLPKLLFLYIKENIMFLINEFISGIKFVLHLPIQYLLYLKDGLTVIVLGLKEGIKVVIDMFMSGKRREMMRKGGGERGRERERKS